MLAVEVWRVPHRGTTDFLLNFKFQMTFQMQMQRYNRFYKLEFEYMIFWATSVWCPLSGASCLGSFQTRSDWTSTVSAEPWLKSYVFFWGGKPPILRFFLPEDGCFLYIFDLNFAKVLDFFLLICGTLLLHWTWEVTSPHFLDPWCPFSRLHQPKVPARAPCQAWCLEANGKFGAVWRLYVNCVWWKIDFWWFLCKNQPLWISLFLKMSFCSKDFVSNLLFLSWSFCCGGGMSSCSIYFEVTDIEAAHIIGNFFCNSCGGRIQIFEPQQLHFQQHVHETTRRREQIDNKKRQRKEDTKKKMNIWTSPSSGMDFFKVGLKTSMWLYRSEKKTNHRLPL